MKDVTLAWALPQQTSACPSEIASSKNGEQVDWAPFGWKPEENNTAGPRGRGVTNFARRLMAAEWARAKRRGPVDLLARSRGRRLGRQW